MPNNAEGMYAAYRTRRLRALQDRGSDAPVAKQRVEREMQLVNDILRGTTGPTIDVTALRGVFVGPLGAVLTDIDVELARTNTPADAPPMPDALHVLATVVSAKEWVPRGCISLSLTTPDLRLAEDVLADADDRADLVTDGHMQVVKHHRAALWLTIGCRDHRCLYGCQRRLSR